MNTNVAQARKIKDDACKAATCNNLEGARQHYSRAVRLDPGDINARQNLAHILNKLGQTSEAIKYYIGIANHYKTQGFNSKAIAMVKIVMQIEPGNQEAQALYLELEAAKHSLKWTAPDNKTDQPGQAADPLAISSLMKLHQAPLFAELSPEEFIAVIKRLPIKRAIAGEKIIREGEDGDSMYFIVSGSVDIYRENNGRKTELLAQLRAGAVFGEIALLLRTPRIASVYAAENTTMLEISRETIEPLARRHPNITKIIVNFCKERIIRNLQRVNPRFQDVTLQSLREMSRYFKVAKVKKGTTIIKQRQPGEYFCVILRGEVEAFRVISEGITHFFPQLREGDCFGEIALLQNIPTTANVKAISDCVLFCLAKSEFKKFVDANPEFKASILKVSTERLCRSPDVETNRCETAQAA